MTISISTLLQFNFLATNNSALYNSYQWTFKEIKQHYKQKRTKDNKSRRKYVHKQDFGRMHFFPLYLLDTALLL